MKMKRTGIGQVFLHAFLLLFAAFSLYPVIIMILGSFKYAWDLASNPAGWPTEFTMNNYWRLLGYNSGIMIRTYFNSIFIAISYTSFTLFFSSLAAFAFAKYNFKGKNVLFLLLMVTMMIPNEVNIPPLYILFSRIKWLNTYYVQIFPGVANVFAMFMLRQYMQSIPTSLIDAARIDGASHFTVYRKIMIPTAMPAIGALAILLFIGKWNEYLWPLVMVNKPKMLPIMVILPTLNEKASMWSIPWELVLTGCVIVTVPLVALFLAFQDKFMSSVTIGAVKE